MSDKSRRPWLQIHLSTAVVLMFVAGALLFFNMTPTSGEYGWSKAYNHLMVPGGDQAFEVRRWTQYGRPLAVLTIVESTPDYGKYEEQKIVRIPASRVIDMSINFPTDTAEYIKFLDPKHDPGERMARGTTPYYRQSWDKQNILFDAMIAFIVFVAGAFACEDFIRRREARAP